MKRAAFFALALLAGCRGPIDLSDAGLPFPCDHTSPDAGEQCTAGWRCGLEDRCHPRGVASDYLCAQDSDCEGGWQCSLSGRCVDARNDGLLATPASQTLVASPLPGLSAVAAPFSAEGFFPSPDPCAGGFDFIATVAWVDGGTLYRENYFPAGRRDPNGPLGGACSGAVRHRTSASVPLASEPLVGMVELSGAIVTLGDAGTLCFVPASYEALPPPFCVPNVLKGGKRLSGHGRFLASYDPLDLLLVDLGATDGGAGVSLVPVFKADAGVEIVSVALEDAFGPPALFVGTTAGLLAGTIDDAGTPSLQPTCAFDVYDELKFVHPRGDYTLPPTLVALGRTLPPNPAPLALAMFPNPSTKSGCAVPGPLGATYYPAESQLCSLPLPERPLDVTAGVLDDGNPFVEARTPGGLLEAEVSSTLSCKPVNPPLSNRYQGPVQTPLSWPGEALTDSAGHVWLNRVPLVPDRAPSYGAGGAANLALAYEPLDSSDPGTWAGSLDTGLELRSLPWAHGRVLSGVAGNFSLWVTSLGVEDRSNPEDAGLLLQLDVAALQPPFHATVAPRDGGSLLVMSAFDAVLSAPLPVPQEDGGYPLGTLSRRLAPVPGAAIDSLAFYGEEPGYFAHGYAVATGLLVEIKGKNPLGWTAEPVDLAQLAPLRVWIDRGRGRVGMLDGTVETLPSRVQVARPIPGEQVLEYQQLCSNTFALTASKVLWLKTNPATGTGDWTPVFVSNGEPLASLYATEQELVVGAATGSVTVLSGVSCPSS